jgi:phospholipid/cholesterol/gamma-HCH transport system substrate-binding protein
VKHAIKTHVRDFVAIIALVAVSAIVGGYILTNQRLRFPVIEATPMEIKAEFPTGQAVTPGQGQTVRVAGVRIGDIARVELKDGRALITLHIDDEYRGMVRADASGLLRPRTGLKDMFIEMNPGSPDAPELTEGDVIPVSNTLPDVNPSEILAGLDADTRDYLKLLLSGAGEGLEGRSDDLREVLRRFEPLNRDIALVTTEGAKRRRELRRLISSLNTLNAELGRRDDDLAELVQAASTTFQAIASERTNVSATVRELPSTLRQATSSLARVEEMANILGPTLDRMQPVARAMRAANRETLPFAREAAPQLRDAIRPFVREVRPLLRELTPTARNLNRAEPGLTRSFTVLNRFFNMLAHNPRGREGPEVAGRDEGYLFYVGWLAHMTNHIFKNQDAHGPGRPLTLGGTCATLEQAVETNPAYEAVLGLTGVLTDPLLCGPADGGGG